MIAISNPTTLQEMHRAAIARRKRFFAAPKIEPQPEPVEIIEEEIPEPEKPRGVILHNFDAHVVAWARHKMNLEGTPTLKRPVKDIIIEMCRDTPWTYEDIIGPRRQRQLVFLRQCIIYRVSKIRPDLSYPAMGRAFGGRDHTTILHAVRKIAGKLPETRLRQLPTYRFGSEMLTLGQIAVKCGVHRQLIQRRVKSGMSLYDALWVPFCGERLKIGDVPAAYFVDEEKHEAA